MVTTKHARVTEHCRGGLRFILPAAHFHFMRRRVMLHFHAGLEVILARRYRRRLPDALSAAERGRRLIRQRRAAYLKLLMDSHKIALAGSQKIQALPAVRFGLLLPPYLRHAGGVQARDFPYARARHLQRAGDLVSAHSLRVQFQNGRSLRLAQHVSLPFPFRCDPTYGSVRGGRSRSRAAPAPAVRRSAPVTLR